MQYQADIATGLDFWYIPGDNTSSRDAYLRLYDVVRWEQKIHCSVLCLVCAEAILPPHIQWVAHDFRGFKIDNHAPFIDHPEVVNLLQRGMPVPMRCSWNGMAVMSAVPFVHLGLRFRAGDRHAGECRSSEVG